jgi:hypothetical protein
MGLFRGDPVAALATAQAALEQAQARAHKLTEERATLLAEGEGENYLSEAASLGHKIASARADADVHRERIVVLHQRVREQELHQREQRKAASIAEVRKALPRRKAAVERLDAALLEVSKAFSAIEMADTKIFADWPDVMPPAHRLGYFQVTRLSPLSSMRKEQMLGGLVREIARRQPFDLTAAVEKLDRELIEELEQAPIPELHDEDAAA